MNIHIIYTIIFVLLIALELLYFRIADHFNIIDKPNERSSYSKVVLRGGGVIFALCFWVWSAFFGFHYPWALVAVTLAAGISFVDDTRSLPDSVRLVVQLVAMMLLFVELGIMQWSMWWVVLIALFVSVGATNIINFMDGINGITGGYSLAVLVPVFLVNRLRVVARNDASYGTRNDASYVARNDASLGTCDGASFGTCNDASFISPKGACSFLQAVSYY